MTAGLGALIAAIVGAILAALAAFGLVSTQSASPAPIDKPYIVYGTS
jgi:hypothetical protein